MDRPDGEQDPPTATSALGAEKPLDIDEVFDLIREFYPFEHSWEQANAALGDDSATDRRGVRQEFDYLTGALRQDGFADPLGVLQPVFDRLRRTNGRPEPIWCPAGWSRLIAETDRRLACVDPDYRLYRVTEKFACLALTAVPSATDELPAEAREVLTQIRLSSQAASEFLCEVCGRADGCIRGQRKGRGRTLCDTHSYWGVHQ
jgi:hypothetical protein